ncbi:DGQHR domain-containing protein [Chamaesiphon sp. OTE_20_metabat_361]|uniref:DGQHR domain-containing protein n=1 Tax=Chamaesiphon sp. OTE_20_metabat_361 TaxID=2964689 RepID=UPI00286C3A94|nr:DGQHR domain-containing protein [Chamaesiphon sp. OTE_20_metabat_361]
MPASQIPHIQPHQILVQRTNMGGSEAYIGSVTLQWLADRVKYASEMSLLSEQYQPRDNNIAIDSDSIEVIQQRPLDWSRQAALVQYLAGRTTHKFPPVLVTIDRSWVDNIHAPEWGRGGKATASAAMFVPIDGHENFGRLDVGESVRIYALDGQHRLMGVQGLMELLRVGELPRYNKYRELVGNKITIAELGTSAEYLASLPQETIGIEFISAVVKDETQLAARRRIRSIFVHVNLMAIALSKGQLAQLDENDGFAIVARNIAVNHPLLKDLPGRSPRVNWDSATVATKTTVLTTLQALQDMAAKYLQYQFPHWKPKAQKGLVPLRPDTAELAAGIAAFGHLFDRLSEFTSYGRLKGEDTPKLRRFSFEIAGGEGHLLFRPVGQVAFAQGVGMAVFKKQMAQTEVFRKLDRYDADGGFGNIDSFQSLWYGILYDPNKKRILVSGRDLAAKLIVYLLGGVDNDFDRAELRRQVAEARTVGDYTMSFDGKLVTPQEVGLPPVLT